jgi:hypothetical protein
MHLADRDSHPSDTASNRIACEPAAPVDWLDIHANLKAKLSHPPSFACVKPSPINRCDRGAGIERKLVELHFGANLKRKLLMRLIINIGETML